MPEISIIMPVYNTQNYINKSVHSILCQSFPDFELILINDGSTDYSLFYCKAFAAKDKRIKVLDLPHKGVAAARLAGINAAIGNYIGFVDSDDWVEPGYLEHLYKACLMNNADMVVCHSVCEFGNCTRNKDIPLKNGFFSGEVLEYLKHKYVLAYEQKMRGFCFNCLWDKLFRREIIQNNKSYMDCHVTHGTDTLLSTACVLDCQSICVISNVDYHYRILRDSISHKVEIGAGENLIVRLQKMKRILKDKNYSYLEEKADCETFYWFSRLAHEILSNDDIHPSNQVIEWLKKQSELDGCVTWKEAVNYVNSMLPSSQSQHCVMPG